MTLTSANVFVCQHPIVQQKISELRNAKNTPRQVRELTDSITRLLLYTATQDLNLVESMEAQSPMGNKYQQLSVSTRLALVPILRSGLAMLSAASDLLHDAEIRHLGLFREEATLQPVEYYNKLPRQCNADQCLVLDPMIATGGTAQAAIEILRDWGVPTIKFIAICVSQQGIETLARKFPDVQFFVGTVDEGLDSKGFVVPGIGDCGDRLNNTA
ncbi:hypothetical protein GGI07_000876 [Coemansia sp. Benny D115]|nr:hypothetical protein GGI07_000876 [Coemansia sp. Benny D115]